MATDKKSVITSIQRKSQDSAVSVHYRQRYVNITPVFDHELEIIGNASHDLSIYLAFFGVSIGIAITCIATLSTAQILDLRIYCAFWVALLVSLLATIFFLIKSLISWRTAQKRIKAIQDESPNKEPL